MGVDHGSTDLPAVDLARPRRTTFWKRFAARDAGPSGSAPPRDHDEPVLRRDAPAGRPTYSPHGDELPRNDFLQVLDLEKRRSERSKAPLSLVLYRLDDQGLSGAKQAHRLLEMLYSGKRRTDILGHIGDGTIAVLCPDTDEEGTRCFMRKLGGPSDELRFDAFSATYPDVLFDQLADRSVALPFAPLLTGDPLIRSTGGYALKRCVDIVGAATAIVLLCPLMLAVAAAVAASSPGPVVFRQTRLGRGGVPFTFFKFRSMTAAVDDSIHRAYVANLIENGQADAGGDGYKLKADPRVTRVGAWIRKTSLDELPQFFNVLRGEMSLVGPRPPIPYETTFYQPWHLRRLLSVKPGITGLWQVEGRSRVTFNEMVRMDLRYIRDCSLWLDAKIMLKTVVVVFRCTGAS